MKLTENFTLAELTKSETAEKNNIDNTPDAEQVECLKQLCENILQPLRDDFQKPLVISSGFRSKKLSLLVGSKTTSQHCKGQAIDVDDTFGFKTNAEMFEWIRENLEFDQMIWEFGDDKNPDWIHVSYVGKISNRNKCLKAYKENGKTKYTTI